MTDSFWKSFLLKPVSLARFSNSFFLAFCSSDFCLAFFSLATGPGVPSLEALRAISFGLDLTDSELAMLERKDANLVRQEKLNDHQVF